MGWLRLVVRETSCVVARFALASSRSWVFENRIFLATREIARLGAPCYCTSGKAPLVVVTLALAFVASASVTCGSRFMPGMRDSFAWSLGYLVDPASSHML